jgi:hypothetical protein
VRGGRPLLITAIVLAIGVGVDLAVGYSPWPGYGAVIGLLGTVVIVVGSGWLTKLLARPEDYYPAEAPADVQLDLLGPTTDGPTTDGRARDGRGDHDG